MKTYLSVCSFGLLLIGGPLYAAAQVPGTDGARQLLPVTWERLLNAADEPQNWLMHNGTLDSQRYSPLDQINRANVADLELAWTRAIRQLDRTETTPLIVDGVMFVTEEPSGVIAFDAATGETFWRFERELPVDFRACCGRNNRGIAILGDALYMSTPDAHLIALDARTGKELWDAELVASNGYTRTTSPLVVKDRVLAGIAGGELGARSLILAYHAAKGDVVWHTDNARPGVQPRPGNLWSFGRAPTWTAGSYDPQQDLVYWAVGNPWDSNSILAINGDSGNVLWHFSHAPAGYDWRSALQPPMLAGTEADGEHRRTLLWGDSSRLYELDSETGEVLTATPQPRAGVRSRLPAFEPCSRRLYTGAYETSAGQAAERRVTPARLQRGASASLVATGGGLVFGGGADGHLTAWDQENGTVLWESDHRSSVSGLWPISFAVDGVQYIAAGNGESVSAYAVPDDRRGVSERDPAPSGEPVLQFDQYAGVADDDPTPYVRIYSDGSVLVRYPKYMRSSGDYIRRLDCRDVATRLQGAVDDLHRIARGEIQSEVRRLEAEYWKRTTGLTVGPDDPISIFVVNGKAQRRIAWKGLQRQAERLDHPELDRLAEIERWLFALADRDGLTARR